MGEGDVRGQWGNPIEYMMTMVSYAVGLGNVWRFPYLTYTNGGGAFLIPYIIMLILVGMPLYCMESCMGQYTGQGPTKIWALSPLFKGIGWAATLVCWLIALYYNVIVSYCAFYFIESLTSNLPWSDCANGFGDWSSNDTCRNVHKLNLTSSDSILDKHCVNGTVVGVRSPSDEYFYKYVTQMSSGIEELGSINWRLLIAFSTAWIIVTAVLIKGAESLGKVVYVTAIFPYIMITILLINNCLQPGASDGIIFYLTPEWSKLANFEVWANAASQIFFSLGCCIGGLVVMSSYNKFNHSIVRDSIIVCCINSSTSIYAGFSIFSALGTIAKARGLNVSDVATKGPELAFVVYPQALATMPVSTLWSILFYIMMILLGFGSQFSQTEAFVVALLDFFPNQLRKDRVREIASRITIFVTFFILGLPMITEGGLYLFTLVNDSVGVPLLIVGFFETVAVAWVYGVNNFRKNIKEMVGYEPGYYWMITWAGITPVLLFGLVGYKLYSTYTNPLTYIGYIYGDDCPYQYPGWALAIYWLIITSPFPIILFFFLHQVTIFVNEYGWSWQTLSLASQPTKDWKPQGGNKDNEKKEDNGVYYAETPIDWGDASQKEGIIPSYLDNMVHTKSYVRKDHENTAFQYDQ